MLEAANTISCFNRSTVEKTSFALRKKIYSNTYANNCFIASLCGGQILQEKLTNYVNVKTEGG